MSPQQFGVSKLPGYGRGDPLCYLDDEPNPAYVQYKKERDKLMSINPLNHASLPFAIRLVDNQIRLKTDVQWCQVEGRTFLIRSEECNFTDAIFIPAPSMAEVWRELPEEIIYKTMRCSVMVWKSAIGTRAGYWWHEMEIESFFNVNPTDALIDLLIEIRKKGI